LQHGRRTQAASVTQRYSYKPRLGYDIRVKPPAEDEPPIWEPDARLCEAEGCRRKAECRAPKGPDKLDEFYWFCAAHARDYNRAWNFFDGMSADQAAAFRDSAIFGHRPTWKLGQNAHAFDAARTAARGPRPFRDPFDLFGDAKDAGSEAEAPRGRAVSRLQSRAFQSLSLSPEASADEIKRRYKLLVKRFHPDANGGDRSAEEKLQDVIKSYEILKRAGYC